jgi:hypothetical protein
MSGARAAMARLEAAAEPLLTDAAVAPAMRRAAALASEAGDFMDAARQLVPLVLDLEAASDALTAHARRLRDALAEVMEETGAGTIRASEHVAAVTAGRASVVITDASLIPPSLMRQPPPAPDKAAIQKLLREGHAVPGAVPGNARPQLTIRPRSA